MSSSDHSFSHKSFLPFFFSPKERVKEEKEKKRSVSRAARILFFVILLKNASRFCLRRLSLAHKYKSTHAPSFSSFLLGRVHVSFRFQTEKKRKKKVRFTFDSFKTFVAKTLKKIFIFLKFCL